MFPAHLLLLNMFQDPTGPNPGLPDGEYSSGTPSSEHFTAPSQNMVNSSYEGSSREER